MTEEEQLVRRIEAIERNRQVWKEALSDAQLEVEAAEELLRGLYDRLKEIEEK